MRVRALPNVTKEAWSLVLAELDAPGWPVADGAAAVENAAAEVWGSQTTFVPCLWHAATEHPQAADRRWSQGQLPEKVRDHLYTLTREAMASGGPDAVDGWFEELLLLAEAAGLALEPVEALRAQYLPLLRRSAVMAQCAHPPAGAGQQRQRGEPD